MEATPGDRVRVELDTEGGTTVLEGRVLPPAAPKHLTLKLINGYNVSHRNDRILNLDVLETTAAPASTDAPSPPADESAQNPVLLP